MGVSGKKAVEKKASARLQQELSSAQQAQPEWHSQQHAGEMSCSQCAGGDAEVAGLTAKLSSEPSSAARQRKHGGCGGSSLCAQVVAALVALKDRGGSSVNAVHQYLAAAMTDAPSARRVGQALRLVAEESGSRFKLAVQQLQLYWQHVCGCTLGSRCARSPSPSPLSQLPASAVAQLQVSPPVSPPVSPVSPKQTKTIDEDSLTDEEAAKLEEEERQFERLKAFIAKQQQSGENSGLASKARKSAHFVTARTLHGPLTATLSFITSRRSLEMDTLAPGSCISKTYPEEMRGSMTVALGELGASPISGYYETRATDLPASSGNTNTNTKTKTQIEGTMLADGSATLTLGSLDLTTKDLLTPCHYTVRHGGGYVDLAGEDRRRKDSLQSHAVRVYFLLHTGTE